MQGNVFKALFSNMQNEKEVTTQINIALSPSFCLEEQQYLCLCRNDLRRRNYTNYKDSPICPH